MRSSVAPVTPQHANGSTGPINKDELLTKKVISDNRRAQLPIVLASGLLNIPVRVPWWNDMPLRLTA
jgi:hypothetical protein